jgi:hydrogenase maturation protein HypF
MERRLIEVHGIVQGVGFRPFTKGLADRLGLAGYCMNMGTYVRIEAEGHPETLERFARLLREEAPPLAAVRGMDVRPMLKLEGERRFSIRESAKATDPGVMQMPPDAGICPECARELMDKADRRYLHPFIACTHCGPRYTLIEGAPYDRERTVMRDFPLCPACRKEYENSADRRFHAQPVCCHDCGPKLFLIGGDGQALPESHPIAFTRKVIAGGGIAAGKGLGGYHLACDALNPEAVHLLRMRKAREAKPLAVMAPDLNTIRKYCHVSPEEEKLLASLQRPIVLLRKREDADIPSEIAYENPYLGMMLPATGIQMLLHRYPDGTGELPLLVMTSGNLSEEPICITEDCAAGKLGPIADCILAHERRIVTRADDSVVRIIDGRPSMIRRARGYTPIGIPLHNLTEGMPDIFAAGAQTKSTWCLCKKGTAFIGPHTGDLDDLDALDAYTQSMERFCRDAGVFPQAAAHDLHPDYLSTGFAQRFARRTPVQHHHAHMAAVMAENALEGDVLAVILDGMGLGEDGTLWGGEWLAGGYDTFRRAGHLNATRMYGADRAAKSPWLAAAFWLRSAGTDEALELARRIEGEAGPEVDNLLQSGTGSYLTTSAGRLFEAASAMLGIRRENRYEGEAAMALEWAAESEDGLPYAFDTDNDGTTFTLDMRPAAAQMARDILAGEKAAKLAARFHATMAEAVLAGCRLARGITGLERVVLGGGVFQSVRLLKASAEKLAQDGFITYTASMAPANDGGISLGQAAAAAARLKNDRF